MGSVLETIIESGLMLLSSENVREQVFEENIREKPNKASPGGKVSTWLDLNT
jgi:hypothetical protein